LTAENLPRSASERKSLFEARRRQLQLEREAATERRHLEEAAPELRTQQHMDKIKAVGEAKLRELEKCNEAAQQKHDSDLEETLRRLETENWERERELKKLQLEMQMQAD